MEATDTKSEGSVKFDKNFEEDEENNDGENYLKPQDIVSFNARFIQSLILNVQDVHSGQHLIENLHNNFAHMRHLSDSVPNSFVAKMLLELVSQIKQKIKDLEEEVEGRKKLTLEVVNCFIQEFEDFKSTTFNGAYTLLHFMQALLNKEEIPYSNELAKILVKLTHCLSSKEQYYLRSTKETYKMIQQMKDFQIEQFQDLLQNMANYSKYTYLAYVSQTQGDKNILTQIGDDFKDVLLNDKVISNYRLFTYFISFLKALDESTFFEILHSHIDFMMKRTGALMGNIARIVHNLTFNFTTLDNLKLMTEEIFSDQILMKDQLTLDIQKYFEELARKLEDKQLISFLLNEYLLAKFKSSKNSATVPQRQALMAYIGEVIKATKKDQLSEEILQQITLVGIEHFYFNKEDVSSKDMFFYLEAIVFENKDLGFVLDQIKQSIGKASNNWHVQFINETLIKNKIGNPEDLITICAPQFKKMLHSQNFKSAVNYSDILGLISFHCIAYDKTQNKQFISTVVDNEQAKDYILSAQSLVNTTAFLQKPLTIQDIKNHTLILQVLIIYSNQNPGSFSVTQLRDTLCEYLLNSTTKFRELMVYSCFEKICSTCDEQTNIKVLKTLKTKIIEMSQRPVVLQREDTAFKSNMEIQYRMKTILKFLFSKRECELSKEEFLLLLQVICHPFITRNQKDLDMFIYRLDGIFKDKSKTFESYFELYCQDLIKYALLERSGILNHNSTLSKVSANILVLLGHYGQLQAFIGDLTKILNYKPLEVCSKLLQVFEQEFDRIRHYDLMFYSEITKDILKVFDAKDESFVKSELSAKPAGEAQEEEKKGGDEEIMNIDPEKLAAQLMKQNAALKKGAKGAKGKKGAAGAKKSEPTKEKKPSMKKEAEEPKVEDKQQRNQNDRLQIVTYLLEIQKLRGLQIAQVLDIIHRINQSPNAGRYFYLDMTLSYQLQPLIKLLHFPDSRFYTMNFLFALFQADQKTPFFKVKNQIVNSLISISQNKVYQKNQREYQHIFTHFENSADYSDMDKGYLQLILMMTNAVLKDLSVNLSVKEQALMVTSSILESNNKVQNIDLVRVTINMMKSSYSNNNLGNYLNKLFRRITQEELALMLQRLFEYEPIPRHNFMQQLLEFDGPLFCPVWLSTQIWILQFDEDNQNRILARKLWNKYAMVLRGQVMELGQEKVLRNIFHYLRSQNTNIFDASIKAAVAFIELFQTKLDSIVDDLIAFYQSEMNVIENQVVAQVNAQAGGERSKPESIRAQILNDRTNRIGTSLILQKSAYFLSLAQFGKVFQFLITQGCQDKNQAIAQQAMDAAVHIIQTKGPEYSEEILKILEKFINESDKYSESCKNQAVIMIGALSTYLDKTNQKKLIGTFEKMIELLHSDSELIRQSICRCIPQLAKYFEEKSKKFLEDHLRILREGKDTQKLRASAYAIAGIVKGLGMVQSQEFDIFTIIQKECFSHKVDFERKIAGLYLYECLSFSLGKSFEMHIIKILPNILNCIADQKEQVRFAANQTNKSIMQSFSNHAIKTTLPLFLKGLESDNWRSKLASVDALGNMAYCAPKQISGYLPQIVKGIREVLNDTHEKVHAAALLAISNIGSVIKCPEIADILDILIKALSNPNKDLKIALKTLIDTSFVHSIDAPSLSLLIPILDSGLMMHDSQSKQLASKLMGNICDLTHNPADLLPYMKILMPAIRNSLFDSIPEIRASAAKALGSLSKGLGLDNSQDMLKWLRSVLHTKNLLNSERIGAAQGFAEIISSHGVPFFDKIVREEVMFEYNNEDEDVREAYRQVMVFLPTSFDQFQKYLPLLLPLMIEGISDQIEEIRKISTRNVKICIKQFGKKAPNQLVMPIMKMMFDIDFKVRSSSSILMYQLVKELENDIIKSQPKYIDQQTKQEILSSMFILKYDTIESVSIQASQIWKNIIDNQLKVLKQVIKVLIRIVFNLIQKESLEISEMGLNCLRGLSEKFGDKIVQESISIFELYLEKATETAQVIGISKALFNMVEAAPTKILHDIRDRVISIIDNNIYHESEVVRDLAANIFSTIFEKIYDQPYISKILDVHFLKNLHQLINQGKQIESERLQQTLKKMLDADKLKLEDKLLVLCDVQNHENPFTVAQSKIIKTVSPKIAHLIYRKKFYGSVLSSLLSELEEDVIDDQGRIQAVLNALCELVSNVTEMDLVPLNETIAQFYVTCRKKERLIFYVDLISYYCRQSKISYEDYAKEYLKNVLELMNDNDPKLIESIIHCLNSIFDGLQKESQFYLVPLLRTVIEQLAVEQIGLRGYYRKKVDTLKLLEKQLGEKCLVNVLQNSIMHGSIEIRIDSATCFKYIIEFSKPEAIKTDIIKICGALIRVVNDKFPDALKMQIFLALKLILIKASVSVKMMVPQLQTTFLKAFNDTQSTAETRKIVVENLLMLAKIAPKSDPIVKELSSLLDGEKLEREPRIEVAEALALTIKQEGKKIQQAMLTSIQQNILLIFEQKKSFYNEKTLASCAAALVYLSQYLPEPEKLQETLFTQFDDLHYPSISITTKLIITLNNQGTPKYEGFVNQLKEYILATAKNQGVGIEEADKRQLKENLQADSGTLYGVFDVMGYLSDAFLRRFTIGDDVVFQMWYDVINQLGVFSALNQLDEIDNERTLKQVQNFLSSIYVTTSKSKQFPPTLAQTLKDGFQFINSFYLDFDSKLDARDPILNLLMMNLNNYLDVNDAKLLTPLTKNSIAEQCNSEVYKDIVDADIRMMAQDVVFFGQNY